tara:strand:- start:1408 stop:1902 length:495 start_codon:yes stop_codon:yes gene_type:complete
MKNESNRKRLLSYFKDVSETPEDIQDLILRILIHDGYGTEEFCGFRNKNNTVVVTHKSNLLKYLRYVFPRFKSYRNGKVKDQADSQINRQLNNLITSGVLEVVDIKRKKCIIRGRMWENRVNKINKMFNEMSYGELLVKVCMGDFPHARAKFIQDNGSIADVDM